ncbi:hypothetical protein Heshes_21610 [Alicyclobacillus hesperidum]|uniref:Uncharacterized protein n=1 Tax=Alicyclobacillus hesperidum TaxID=89784 RepID=A0AA37TZF8_9BACL|nr:hypothetical protein [Alicyclobacillus hesperidum]KRW91539.1 hypothetical protein SD51_08685 [Alicyclobacillus tengchongensis]GLV14477.1 hypothetical protein Heshes_21610 [Alicyclobacillus hesperidum]
MLQENISAKLQGIDGGYDSIPLRSLYSGPSFFSTIILSIIVQAAAVDDFTFVKRFLEIVDQHGGIEHE